MQGRIQGGGLRVGRFTPPPPRKKLESYLRIFAYELVTNRGRNSAQYALDCGRKPLKSKNSRVGILGPSAAVKYSSVKF